MRVCFLLALIIKPHPFDGMGLGVIIRVPECV